MIRFILLSLVIGIVSMDANAQYLPDEDPFRIAMIGCIRQYNDAPSLQKYAELNADLALWIGDNVYADTEDDPEVIRQSYEQLAAFPAFQKLRAEVPFIVTWDDHDYGDNNEGKHYPLKEQSKQIFRSFWGLEDEIPEDQPGIYNSRIVEHEGYKIQFVMLDVRYNNDDELPDGSGEVLGDAQWIWLEDQLRKEADVRFVASGFQILLDAGTGSETWEYFPRERERLFDLIKTTGAEGVIFLAGDQHYGEVNRLKNALDYDAIELQFSGVNQIEGPEPNSHRVSTVASSMNSYAYIDLFPAGTENDYPYVQFSVRGFETDQYEVSYRVRLNEIRRRVELKGQQRFADSTYIAVHHEYPHLMVRYTIDGSDPEASDDVLSSRYIDQTLSIRYALFDDDGNRRSTIHERTFEKLEPVSPVIVDRSTLTSGLQYSYIEGAFEKIPEFDPQLIKRRGIAETFSPSALSEQDDHYALQFTGYIEVERSGLYTFTTRSDDGSRLYISNELVVDNDGSHSARSRSGLIVLEAGLHPFRLDYFEDYSGQSLNVFMQFEQEESVEIDPVTLFTLKN